MEKSILTDDSEINNILNIFENSITELLCEDIIEMFEREKSKCTINFDDNKNDNYYSEFIIPKNDKNWEKIERILYKELLTKVYKYKQNLIKNSNNKLEMEILSFLNNGLLICKSEINIFIFYTALNRFSSM